MANLQSLVNSLSEKLNLTRRGFVKGTLALGAAASLYGCSKGDGEGETVYTGGGDSTDDNITATPQVEYIGTSPHNCGGGACVLKAYVADGKIKRLATDERPDLNMLDSSNILDAQRRGCVRCRSKKEWFFRNDRLLYPLKQTKKRGDLSGFVRISWRQAYKEIASEMHRIQGAYGAETFHKFYSTGDGASYPRSREFSARLLYSLGGEYAYRDDYSYPSWYTAGHFTWGYTSPNANSAPDLPNADVVLLWSCNLSEMIANCNSSWYMTQARDLGVKIISVDQRLSKSATTLSTGAKDVPPVITPVGGTDAALIAAMLYHLLDKHLKDESVTDKTKDSTWIKPQFISKYVHGFFDNEIVTDTFSYDTATTKTNYPVAEGGSYSAYIFGNDDRLVTATLNKKVSIYPDQIGYNTSDTGWGEARDQADPLHGKYAPLYGQVPKTPEWAEKITGIPADVIRKFAELCATTQKLTIVHDGGFQRNTEGEQGVRSLMVLAGVLGAFGASGQSFGKASGNTTSTLQGSKYDYLPNFAPRSDFLKFNDAFKQAIENGKTEDGNNKWSYDKRYDLAKVTNGVSKKDGIHSHFPVFMWQDAIERGSTGNSRWANPDIKNGPPIKLIFNFGGNCVANQCGDYNFTTSILSLANKQVASVDNTFPNRQYQLELLITTDHFMTTSAQWSDYVLPAAMAFERSFYKYAGNAMHYSPKIVDAPGEVKSDFDMTIGIAEALGVDLKEITTDGLKDEEAVLRKAFTKPNSMELTFDEFKKMGVMTSSANDIVSIPWQDFRNNPSTSVKLKTPTGKIEAYSQGMMEYYAAIGFINTDPKIILPNTGSMFTKTISDTDKTKGRIVYPIPMYIPLVEGRHACDIDATAPKFDGEATSTINATNYNGATKHPDLLGTNDKSYKYRLHCWHMQYRSHSTLNSNAYLNECYKLDIDGNPAFYDPKRGQDKVYGVNGAIVDTNIYEPVFVNPTLADEISLPTNGSRVLIWNDRGAIYAYAKRSELVQYGEIMIGQGAWTQQEKEETAMPNGVKHKIDIGGNANSVFSIRPSRICQGMTLSNDCKVGIVVK